MTWICGIHIRLCNKLDKFLKTFLNKKWKVIVDYMLIEMFLTKEGKKQLQRSLKESSIYCILIFYRSSHLRCFIEISLNSEENTFTRIFFLIKVPASQVFSCEFCEIFKNTCFTEHLRTTASDFLPSIQLIRANQFFLVLSVGWMRDVFLLSGSKKAMMQFHIALDVIPKIKPRRRRSEFQ